MFVADSRFMSPMVNSLRNITNLRELKTVVKTGNKKMMTGFLRVDWKGYHKRDGKLYLVACNDTAYIPDLGVNIFNVTHVFTKRFNLMS